MTFLLVLQELTSLCRCSDIRPKLSDADEGTIVVTECWVEGCCFEETLLSPDKHIVFRPLPGNMPIAGES